MDKIASWVVKDCDDPHDFVRATNDTLRLSGSGLSEEVLDAMRRYMAYVTQGRGVHFLTDAPAAERLVFALCAEIAAEANLVEYGVALNGAWATPEGCAWIADFDAWHAKGRP